jgi:murein DD-endopeptidase MepM/ murein hydrolase activator NlpD
MKTTAGTGRTLLRHGIVLAAAIVAGCTSAPSSKAPVEVRGTDPNAGAARAGSNTLNNSVIAAPDANGIITYDGYQSVIAREGDTVAVIADRIGMSASELGAYNGLSPSYTPRAGDELVLPPRPGGYGAQGSSTSVVAPASTTSSVAVPSSPQTSTIEQTPLGTGAAVNPDGTLAASSNNPSAIENTAAPSAAPQPQAQPTWSPDLAAAAIKRSTGIQDDGSLGQPPSSAQPVPPEPAPGRELASPQLGQYQTGEAPEAATASQIPVPESRDQLAANASTQPVAPPPSIKLVKPVDGPIAVGFNKGAGPARNDGVDFAAPAGAPVVSAADGEVALVSQSLGGLGTIVLVRHADDLLTVYGRVDGVLVNKGDLVRSGQQIGVVSDAAAPAEPRMHFEVRRGAESLDPTDFL